MGTAHMIRTFRKTNDSDELHMRYKDSINAQ